MAGELWNKDDATSGLLRDSTTGELLTAHATLPCPCCEAAEYVELVPCCEPPEGGGGATPYPPGTAPWYILLATLQEECAGLQAGYLVFNAPAGGGEPGEYCMRFNLVTRPPIPASALPAGATVLVPDTLTCTPIQVCDNLSLCPACPQCCHEIDFGYKCMRAIDPHPSNPTGFLCNFGREYRVTYTMTGRYERREQATCVTGASGTPVGRCWQKIQANIDTDESGVLTFRKACEPDFVPSCTGSATRTRRDRLEDFGNDALCNGTLSGGFVNDTTTTQTVACGDWTWGGGGFGGDNTTGPWAGLLLESSVTPEEEDCFGFVVRDGRCLPDDTGPVVTRETTEWSHGRGCFDGATFYRRTNQWWRRDPSSCPPANFFCPGDPVLPCNDTECFYESSEVRAEYSVEILSFEECGSPWQTVAINTGNGYPLVAGGFWDGWAIGGFGNAEEFL